MSLISRLRAWPRPRASVPAVTLVAPLPALPARPERVPYVDEVSAWHVSGWLPGGARRVFEAVLPTGEVLATGIADEFKLGLTPAGHGQHGFFARFSRTLNAAEQAQLRVHAEDGSIVQRAVWGISSEYRPVMLNAMDLTNNCNLRCPFCVVDYSATNKTFFMDDATFEAALRLMPFALDANFWFSCLHEPTLHPRFAEFLARVPQELRRRVFFTSNFAKKMPAEYFALLAGGGFGAVNISIESRDPTIYERMRAGARFPIFMANWNAFMAALAVAGDRKPYLRYIVMVYKSNLAEIPELVAHLVEQRGACEIQLRFTFDMPHIPAEFRDAEYVDDAAWDWLAARVAHYPPALVQVVRPPPPPEDREGVMLQGRFDLSISWDGTVKIKRFWAIPFSNSGEPPVAVVNMKDIEDWPAYFASLAA